MAKKKQGPVKVDIQFIQSPSGEPYNLAYHVGEVAVFSKKQAQELIDLNYAILNKVEQTTD